MKKVIPSVLTCLALISGSISIVYSLQKEMLVYAGYFIIIAAIFDFLDGFFARLFKTVSDFGIQLDSLSDLVSFGIAPSMILYRLLLDSPGIENELILYSAFLIGVFSALRLARFNIDNEQKTYFKGLPTPASAILIASIGINHDTYFLLFKNNENVYNIYLLVTLVTLIAIICYLLVSNIRMFSLKFKNAGFRGNGIRYIFLLLTALIIILFRIKGLAPVIVLYILLSLINNWIIKLE
jgi:CDP-diacylglycerol--serine O-phosphatidyltransferase